MSQVPSYIDFAEFRSKRNPCLKPLADLLKRDVSSPTSRKPTIFWIDFLKENGYDTAYAPTHLQEVLHEVEQAKKRSKSARKSTQPSLRRIAIIEDIDHQSITALGSCLDIDPEFFANYILTDFGNIETVPAPPSLSLLPSHSIAKDSIHIHYQQIVQITNNPNDLTVYKFNSPGNIQRAIRCLPVLSGIQPAIMRGCCSSMLKRFEDGSWLCLILIDSSRNELLPQKRQDTKGFVPSPRTYIPFQGGFEDFIEPETFSNFTSTPKQPPPAKTSFLQNLLWCYQHRPPPGLDANNPTLLSLAYCPLKIISSHWMVYVLLLNRYYKYYEYSVNKPHLNNSALGAALIDLQRWRRRARQSLTKVKHITQFINFHASPLQPPAVGTTPLPQAITSGPSAEDACASLLADFTHIMTEIDDYNCGLEFLISIPTAMVQLSTGQQPVVEAVHVRRLTYVALVFGPLGLVASLFSMSGDFLPGEPRFWVYVVAAAAMLGFVVSVVFLTDTSVQTQIGQAWRKGLKCVKLG